MNRMKRFLAMALVLCMALGAVPLHGFAETTEEEQALASQKSELSTMEQQAAEAIYALTAADSTASHMDNKPADGTVTGEPFDTTVSKNYRIPGLVNHNGTLIATADARWNYEYDGGGMDLVVSRSTDGNTWNYTFAGYLGDNGNVWNNQSSTLMDPVIATDGKTLYLFADMYPAGYSISSSSTAEVFSDTAIGFDASGNLLLSKDSRSTYGYYLKDGKIYTTAGVEESGYTVKGWFDLYKDGAYETNLFFADSPYQVRATSYICMSTSTDGGVTWSAPTLLNVKPEGVAWMVLGPGSGIVTSDDNIAFTAYDGSNIYLIYGKEGTWKTVSTSAATNESSIIELNDGTIRAFVKRAGSNTIAYVDFTKAETGGYTAETLVDTGVANFSQCMVSSLHYSKTLKGKEVVLVCCPSDSSGGEWAGRFNGKIYAYTLDDNNAMTLVGTHQLNNSFFAYSNMAELTDGTIGVLYEDGCINYQNTSYGGASHITYTTVNLETALGKKFDIAGKLYAADTVTNEEVTARTIYTFEGDEDLTINGLSSQTATVTSSDEGVVTAKLSDDYKTLTLTPVAKGTATVTVTATVTSTATATANTLSTGTNTFTVDVTVSSDKTENITLLVGETVTIKDSTGDYTAAGNYSEPNSTYATMNLTGGAVAGGKKLNAVAEIESGKQYLIVNNRAGGMLTDDTTTYSNDTGLLVTGTASVDSTELWTITSVDDQYTLTMDGKHLSLTSTTSMSESVAKVNLVYENGHWLISEIDATTPHYLSDLYGASWDGATGYTVYDDGGNYWTIYEIVEVQPETYTEITFKGVAPGEVKAKVGNTTYNITVKEDIRDILLYVGTTKTDIITDKQYGSSDVSQTPDSTVVSMDVAGKATAVTSETKTVTQIESGKQYLICNVRSGNTLTATDDSGKLILSDKVSTTNENLWTIKSSDTGYTVQYGTDGEYLTIGDSSAGTSTTETALTLSYQEGGYWYIGDTYKLNDFGGNGTVAAGWSGADAGSQWMIYEIVDNPAESYTEVTFTGVTAGKTTAKIGSVTYNITVKVPVEGDISGFNNIVGTKTYDGDNDDVELTGKKITALTIDADSTSSFQLGVDLADADLVVWSIENAEGESADPVATIDQNGNVSGLREGNAKVTATVYKNGVYESITIPVHVIKSFGDSTADGVKMTTVCYYVEQVVNTKVWYSLYGTASNNEAVTDELVEVTEGQVIYFQRPENTKFGMIWMSAPEDGYALTFMAATGSEGEYYPLHNGVPVESENEEDPPVYTLSQESGYFASELTTPYYNLYNSYGCDKETIDKMLTTAINEDYYAAGAMSMGRKANDDTPRLGSSLSFISEKLATVEKSVQGILPVSRLYADYRTYYDGMIATTGELVYFKVTVTLERPSAWDKDNAKKAALQYSGAKLSDTALTGAYFYTKEDDAADSTDGTLDGLITTEDNRKTEIDITDALNAEWEDDETVRVLEYYVLYEIQKEDIPKYVINNTADYAYTYSSSFSAGSGNVKADAKASITVVTKPMDNVVIDFCQPITITGLTNDHLKYAFVDTDTTDHIKASAHYGKVSVTKVQQQDEQGNLLYDGNNYPQYDYKVVYTPTQILTEPDAIQIWGTFVDTDTKQQVTKVINGFTVYPATTIYYEEDYVKWDTGENGWSIEGTDTVTGEQDLDYLGDTTTNADNTTTANKKYNYGYDPVYAKDDGSSNGASSGTQATTSTVGAKGTFTFTGTGFEVYANCTPDTGYVMVLVKSNSGTGTRLYTVNTAVGIGSSNATSGQTGNFYSVPIVSVQDLDHDTYTVSIIKSIDVDENGDRVEPAKQVNIDGVRIFGTIENQSIYMTDGENDPSYVELRDLVLTVVGVQNVTESAYDVTEGIISQVYSDTGSLASVVVLDGKTPIYASENVKDLLENGPKNELYLWPGQAVTFNLTGTAQIGMKTVSGTKVNYTYANNGATTGTAYELNSSTDMFYHDGSTGAVTISNTGDSGVLSITLLKYWNATAETLLAEVTEAQVAYAVMSLRGPAVDESQIATLTVNYVTMNGRKAVSVGDKVVSLPSRKIETVTLTKVQTGEESDAVFTAEEIRAAIPGDVVIRDLQDIHVPYGQTVTRTFFASQANQAQQTYVLTRTY